MDPAMSRAVAPVAFEDGFGQRRHIVGAGSESLEILALRETLTAVPSFEFALRERVSRLANFRHACYGHVCGVSRLDQDKSTLALVTDYVIGDRLSDILTISANKLLPIPVEAALCIIRQLVDAVAILHETVREVSHGAIAPERIIISPDARLVVVEHVFGAALATLSLTRERYWKEMRIALPPTAGPARFDRRADVTQIGAVALALLMGRPLGNDDYPGRISEIVARVGAFSATGGLEPLADAVRTWLSRALQLDTQHSFASAVDARTELESALAQTQLHATPATLKSFLAQYSSAAAEAAAPPPAPTPRPVAAPSRPAASVPRREVRRPDRASPQPPPHAYLPLRGMAEEAKGDMSNSTPSRGRRLIAIAAALVALTSAGLVSARYVTWPASADTSGTLVVNTNPAGVTVMIDGQRRGTSPLTAKLAAGPHVLEIVTEGDRRQIPVTITAGGHVSQFIEVPKVPPQLGQLQVRTDPAGAKVTVDGHLFGSSPVTVGGLTPGIHTVVLEGELASMTEEVTIEAGTTASLVVPLGAPRGAPVSGWITVSAPADVQIYENERLLGSSRSDRIMVAAGRHTLEVVNESLGYRSSHTVQVAPGQVAPIRLAWPKGSLALNALPWADVWVDGERVGETPIGNLSVPIGPHEVVFRHPDLGEQRHHITVTLSTPARLSVDFKNK